MGLRFGSLELRKFVAILECRDKFRIVLKRDFESSRVVHLRYEKCVSQRDFIAKDERPVAAEDLSGQKAKYREIPSSYS